VSPLVNLLRGLPDACAGEVVDTLVVGPAVRIERIVSHGQCSPAGFWYDQAEAEFVVLLAGAARLRFADEDRPRSLMPGDSLPIAAHRRHRVEWTDPAQATVWLAIIYREGAG